MLLQLLLQSAQEGSTCMEEDMVAEKLGEEAPVTQQSSASTELGSGDISVSTEETPKPRRRRTRKVATLQMEERRVGKECRSRWSPYH